MSDEQIISILQNTDWFALTSPVNYIFRVVGWFILTLLVRLSNALESIVNKIYSLNGFFRSEQLDAFIDEMMPLIWVILAISIAFLGMKIIFDREFKVNAVIKNVALAISIVVLLPMGMDHLGKMTSAATDGIQSEYKLSANKVLKDNLYDSYYFDSRDFSNSDKKNNIPEDRIINTIQINEEVDTNEVKNKDVFSSKLLANENGEITKGELDSIFFGLFSENYYRFNFKFWNTFLILFCTSFTLLISSIKVARIIFELGFVKLFGLLYSFADITTGQKTKEIIRCIVSNFIILFIISVLLKMYLMFSTWSAEQSDGLVRTILLMGASLAVIDGPNIVERVLGIDAGVKSGWSAITGIYGGAKLISDAISDVNKAMSVTSKAVGKAAKISGNTGAGLLGFAKGLQGDKKSSLEEQMAQSGNNISDLKGSYGKNLHDEMNDFQKNSQDKSDSNNGFKDNLKTENNISGDKNNLKANDNTDPLSSSIDGFKNLKNDTPPKLDSEMKGNINDISSMNKDIGKESVPPLEEAMTKETPTSSESEKLESSMNKVNDSPTMENRARESSVDHQINSNNDLNSKNSSSGSNDNRTFAGYVNNQMRANPTIQSMHKSYTIGKNTGYSLSNKRKSIMKKKRRK